MGTIAATVTRDQLASGHLTRAVVSSALTAGFSAAFVAAGLFAIGGFVATLIFVRHRRASASGSPAGEVEIAA